MQRAGRQRRAERREEKEEETTQAEEERTTSVSVSLSTSNTPSCILFRLRRIQWHSANRSVYLLRLSVVLISPSPKSRNILVAGVAVLGMKKYETNHSHVESRCARNSVYDVTTTRLEAEHGVICSRQFSDFFLQSRATSSCGFAALVELHVGGNLSQEVDPLTRFAFRRWSALIDACLMRRLL